MLTTEKAPNHDTTRPIAEEALLPTDEIPLPTKEPLEDDHDQMISNGDPTQQCPTEKHVGEVNLC